MLKSDYIVKVHRYCGPDDSPSWFGWFYSFVYAIRDNEMLVYDDGDSDIMPGFKWVDFTEEMLDINDWRNGTKQSIVELPDLTELHNRIFDMRENGAI